MFIDIVSDATGLITQSSIIIYFFFALCLLSGYRIYLRRRGRLAIPRIGEDPGWFGLAQAKRHFIANGASIVENGYQRVRFHKTHCHTAALLISIHNKQYKDSMFLIQTADMERIVLSNKYVDEIRTAPESVLSVREGMCEVSLWGFLLVEIARFLTRIF